MNTLGMRSFGDLRCSSYLKALSVFFACERNADAALAQLQMARDACATHEGQMYWDACMRHLGGVK